MKKRLLDLLFGVLVIVLAALILIWLALATDVFKSEDPPADGSRRFGAARGDLLLRIHDAEISGSRLEIVADRSETRH